MYGSLTKLQSSGEVVWSRKTRIWIVGRIFSGTWILFGFLCAHLDEVWLVTSQPKEWLVAPPNKGVWFMFGMFTVRVADMKLANRTCKIELLKFSNEKSTSLGGTHLWSVYVRWLPQVRNSRHDGPRMELADVQVESLLSERSCFQVVGWCDGFAALRQSTTL